MSCVLYDNYGRKEKYDDTRDENNLFADEETEEEQERLMEAKERADEFKGVLR